MRVLITEALNAPVDSLGGSVEIDLQPDLWKDRQALLREVAGCHALIVRNRTFVDKELIAQGASLRVVGRLGAGLDNLDLESLARTGVRVVHGGGLNSRAVAEFVVGAAFDLARGLARSDRAVRDGEWYRYVGIELKDRTLGVIGLGKTGLEVARLGQAVGMRVVGYDSQNTVTLAGVRRVSFEQVLRRSHIVSLHVPLTSDTMHLIGATQLASMQPRAILINASRGEVVDEDALYDALCTDRLSGAALDVRRAEPSAAGDRFAKLPNVLLTPHLAGLTAESQTAIANFVLTGVRRALGG
jgi:phosphoglycerate dehydrogenase-like enzyme